jgi:hypothetical protein
VREEGIMLVWASLWRACGLAAMATRFGVAERRHTFLVSVSVAIAGSEDVNR